MDSSFDLNEDIWCLALGGLGAGVTDWNIVTGEARYSHQWHDMLGYVQGEIPLHADEWMKRIHPDDMPQLQASMALLFSGEIPTAQLEFRMRCKDGRWKWVLGHALIVSRDAAGQPLRLIGVNLDIDNRKRAETVRDALFEAIGDAGVGLFALNQGRMVFSNATMSELTGYTQEELLAFQNVIDAGVHPDEQERIHRLYEQRLNGSKAGIKQESRLLTRDGASRDIEIAVTGMPENSDFQLIGLITDITARKSIEEDLRLALMVYEHSSEAMSVTSANGRIITVNPAFLRITGYTFEEVVGRSTRSFGIDPSVFKVIKKDIDTLGHWEGEILNRRKDGDIYPVTISINTIFDHQHQPYRYVTLFSDITNRKQAEALIWRQANFDGLTQLANRSMFHERVGQETRKANRTNTRLALLFIDLDHFKEVNDTLGHDTGDHLLLEVAHRLMACVRETDVVGRLGGDEFTVLLTGLSESGSDIIVERIASDIIDTLAGVFKLGNNEVYVSASVGITFYPNDAHDIEGLFRNADQAMYLSKNQGRNRYSYFTPALQDAAQLRLRMMTDLRSALTCHQLEVHFQPVIELATGRIVKAEALLRWQHPERGMILPTDFIPLAEESGLIHEIGDWVFRQVAYWVQRWKQGTHRDFQISINKSPVQFHKDVSSHLEWMEHLESLGLPGNSISIEITENVLLNADPAVTSSLLGCRDAGIQVAIDDFGTGYSSLAYLNRFDIDYLKIDRSFIGNLMRGSSEFVLSEAIIAMAHKLGLEVIAEGVETEAQRDLLTAIGCDYMQGFLFSKALPPEEFEALLLNQIKPTR